jgi:hypothetical protein
VAATRFLPGVFSFLCTLSFLERVLLHWTTSHSQSSIAWPQQSMGIRHRFPQTSSTMENRSQCHGFGTEILRTGSISGSGCTRILHTQHGLFQFKNRGEPTLSESNTSFWFSTEVYTGFLRARHRIFGSRGSTSVLCKAWVSCTAQSPYTLRQSRWKMGEDPSHGSSWPFYSHGLGLTLVTLETACIYPARITFLMVRNLR